MFRIFFEKIPSLYLNKYYCETIDVSINCFLSPSRRGAFDNFIMILGFYKISQYGMSFLPLYLYSESYMVLKKLIWDWAPPGRGLWKGPPGCFYFTAKKELSLGKETRERRSFTFPRIHFLIIYSRCHRDWFRLNFRWKSRRRLEKSYKVA